MCSEVGGGGTQNNVRKCTRGGGLFKERTYGYAIFKRLVLAKHPKQRKLSFKNYRRKIILKTLILDFTVFGYALDIANFENIEINNRFELFRLGDEDLKVRTLGGGDTSKSLKGG